MAKSKGNPMIPVGKLEKLDRFIAYATGDEDALTFDETEEFLILSLVDDQLRMSRSWQKIARVVEVKANKRWSKATTFRWISYAKYVFGTTKYIDKDYERQRIVEWFEKAIHMALQEKDYWFLGKQLKQFAEILKLNENDDTTDEKFTPHQYILQVINQIGQPARVDLANTKSLAPQDRRKIAQTIQISALPESLDDAVNLQPPIQSDSLDE